MGQYFKPSITLPEQDCQSIDIDCMAKFMEHGYLFNSHMMAVLSLLKELSKQSAIKYAHVGDYSEKHEGYSAPKNDDWSTLVNTLAKSTEAGESVYEQQKKDTLNTFIFNETKKEKVSLQAFYEQRYNTEQAGEDPNWAVSLLNMLCTTEQKMGGGDYYYFFRGNDLSEGGAWLGDDITVSETDKDGYIDITHECLCTETEEEYFMLIASARNCDVNTIGVDPSMGAW